MRALYLTILCSSSLIIQSSGQSLAPVGARWYIVPVHEYHSQNTFLPYFMLEVTGDTLIDGRVVHIFSTADGNVPVEAWTGYLTEENGQILYYENGEFVLLYDYNLPAGESMEFRIPDNRYSRMHEEPCPQFDNVNNVSVDSTDSIEVDGVLLRRLFTSYDQEHYMNCVDLEVLIERVGTPAGIFGEFLIYHAAFIPEHVACYTDDEIQFSFGNAACDFIAGKPFAPFNATWHFEDISSDCSTRQYLRIESKMTGVDIYSGDRFVRVFASQSTEPLAEVTLRHDFDQVRFREDGEYKLLYDFSLESGDTMTFSVPRNRHHFDIACKDSVELEESYLVVVDSVTIVEVDGLSLRALHTSPVGDQCIDLGVITEKFGSSNGLFGTLCDGCGTGCPGHFRCYEDNDLSFMASVEACDFTTSLRKTPDMPDMIVYPVPASDHLRLSGIVPGDIVRLDIIDMLGRSYQVPVGLSIDLSPFEAGQYMLSVWHREGLQSFRRFVKM